MSQEREAGAGWRGTGMGRRDWMRSRQRSQLQRRDELPRQELKILYEDNHLLVIHKPAGLLSQADATGDPSAVELARDYLRQAGGKPGNVFVGLIHRLDRPVSGVLLLARTSKAADRLTRQVRARTIEKVYLTVVEGEPATPTGELRDHLLKPGTGRRVQLLAQATPESREAVLQYRQLAAQDGCSLLEIRLITGRSHQIRAQLAGAGLPILGDLRYGSRHALGPGEELALCAQRVRFTHPTREEELTIEAPLPPSWPWPPPRPHGRAEAAEPRRPRPRAAGPSASMRPAAPRAMEEHSPPPQLRVLYRDPHLLVVDKPADLPVQPTLDPTRPNLQELARELLAQTTAGTSTRPPALATRLRVGVSGVVVLTTSRSGARALDAQLQSGELRRLYLLGLEGQPPVGEPGQWHGSEADCRYCLVSRGPQGFLLAVEPQAGPASAVERLLEQRGWRPLRQGARELSHLFRIRLHSPEQPAALELTAPCPAGFEAVLGDRLGELPGFWVG